MSDHEPEVVQWYTAARKFPKLIGALPGGGRIWGGPYTQTGFVMGVVVLLAATRFPGLWAHFNVILNGFLLLGAAWGTAWGMSKLPVEARNPLAVVAGLRVAATAPQTGRLNGAPIRPPRPVRVRRGRVQVAAGPAHDAPSATQQPEPSPAPVPSTVPAAVDEPTEPTPQPVEPSTRPMSHVQLLLAAASKE